LKGKIEKDARNEEEMKKKETEQGVEWSKEKNEGR
jgi:hypothetical protein